MKKKPTEQERFEKWAEQSGYNTRKIGTDSDHYWFDNTHLAWRAWQARARLARREKKHES